MNLKKHKKSDAEGEAAVAAPDMLPELNPKQKEAAEAPEKPLLIVAGAGTGKTRTLTSRLRHLITKGVPPENICAITFTNKAAREMAERIGIAQQAGRAAPFIGTFHSLGARILRAEAKSLGRNANFVIFDDHDSAVLIKKIVKSLGEETGGEGPAYFVDKITRIKNGMLAPQDANEPTRRVFSRYEAELKKHNAFDFDDLIQKVVLLFKSKPATLAKYQKRLRHILVDEYQDLNNTQYELIRLLAGDSRKISVVGDEAQCIYTWRGSNFGIFLNFERDWPEATVVVLDENYRSSQNIIAAASAVIKNNLRQKPKNLWTRNAPGELVKLAELGDENEEAEWIAAQIQNSKAKNQNESIVILYRTNAQSRALEQALIERNIPYRVFGGIKFYERKEVKDVLAGLRFALNPKDTVSRERLEKTLGKTKFADFALEIKNKSNPDPAEAIRLFLESSDYFEYLKKNFTNWAERRENVAELLYFAAKFKELTAFLEEVALLQATDPSPLDKVEGRQAQNAVQLMTIHLAKGLEFDRVFVAGCTEGILPHTRSLGSLEELEEERRLMYVAMTRAKKELCLSFYDLPSRFLSEMPEELIRFESLVSDAAVFSDDEERYITLD